jgi:hypothetical protein
MEKTVAGTEAKQDKESTIYSDVNKCEAKTI